ncbi:MAG: hypothetical protein ACE5NG_06130 [bacterium]
MFRINKVFENPLTYIYKVEGEITQSNLSDWAEEVNNLLKLTERQIILELCEVSYMCPNSVEFLIQRLTGNIYLFNCPIFVKNMLKTAGRSANVLE